MSPMDRNIWLVHIAAAWASVSFLLELTLLFASVSGVGFLFHVLSTSVSSSVKSPAFSVGILLLFAGSL